MFHISPHFEFHPRLNMDRERRKLGNELLTAARKGNDVIVKQVISQDRSLVDYPDKKNRTSLLRAIMNSHTACIDILLEYGADVNAMDQEGWTPLHAAARSGMDSLIAVLIDKGARIEALTAQHLTPLYCASLAGNVEAASALLTRGANPHIADMSGATPLHVAELPNMTRLLVVHGATINAVNNEGYSPLHIAALNKWFDNAATLVQLGADVNANTGTQTPLSLAASNADDQMCSLLIEKGANVNDRNLEQGRSPLHVATINSTDDIKTIKVLLAAGADVNAQDNSKITPLHLAALHQSPAALQALLEAGAKVSTLDVDGLGALDWSLGVTPARIVPRRRPQITPCASVLLTKGAQVSAAALASHPEVKSLIQSVKEQHGQPLTPTTPSQAGRNPWASNPLPAGAEVTPPRIIPAVEQPVTPVAAAPVTPKEPKSVVQPLSPLSPAPTKRAEASSSKTVIIIAAVVSTVAIASTAAFLWWRRSNQ